MHLRSTFRQIPFSLILILYSLGSVEGQENSRTGSITMIRCEGCGEILVPPTVAYPGYVGFGPHTYSGEVSVLIVINQVGRVQSARGISGHPYFRTLLEKASVAIRTSPTEERTPAHCGREDELAK